VFSHFRILDLPDSYFLFADLVGFYRLLEKCKANIKKLVVEVMHMMQNEAGPSNNNRPDNRKGVSSEFS
jgi:hypothetical protein